MGFVDDTFGSLSKVNVRLMVVQLMSFTSIIAHSLIIWQGLVLVTGTKSPIVVVLSASMEPAFKRGDIVFLHNPKSPIRSGDIVVYQLAGRDIPIIHRVIRVHERETNGMVEILTKGDNNVRDDRLGGIYDDAIPGLMWLEQEHIIGRAAGLLPSVGWATLIMQDYPMVKYVLLPAIGLVLFAVGCFE